MSSKRHIRNFLISTLSALGIVCLYLRAQKKQGPLVRVVVFHDVTDGVWFTSMLETLVRRYHVLTPEAFVARQFDARKVNVLITFDDGYASWHEVCAPSMQELGVRAVFFVNSGLVDAYDDPVAQAAFVQNQLLLSPRRTISWNGVRELIGAGHTIGGHTKTHARLAQLQEDVVVVEIAADKDRIQEMASKSPTLFAYPFGNRSDFGERDMVHAEEVGYTHAFSTEPRFVHVNDRFAIPRLCIEDGVSATTLAQWVEGGYDCYAKIKRICAR
jgi:peptidoglycan/xylan/chitin deacetylase (PgdA/CDA1 family)